MNGRKNAVHLIVTSSKLPHSDSVLFTTNLQQPPHISNSNYLSFEIEIEIFFLPERRESANVGDVLLWNEPCIERDGGGSGGRSNKKASDLACYST